MPSYVSFPGDSTGVRYGEGLFVGYRGYDAAARDVAFPFGHGLSYTTFEYSDLTASASGNDVTVSVRVTNTGRREGREVVQVYVSKPDSAVVRGPRELKGFSDVTLAPGESGTVTIHIPGDELAYWSVLDEAWVVERGQYGISVGASSRDLRGEASVSLEGDAPFRPLTLSSTVGEALANPVFAEMAHEIVAGSPFAADDESLGVDAARMMADFPLSALAGFIGKSTDELQALLDEVNAAS